MHPSDTGPKSPNQDVRTPRDVLDAIEKRFGKIDLDLAAENREAAVADLFISPEQDALADTTVWPTRGILWLNPPFSEITPWAEKCARWMETAVPGAAKLLFLVPASIDSNWWDRNVRSKSRPIFLRPRVKFVGHKQGFPKPIAVCVFDPSWPQGGPEELWDYLVYCK